VKSWQLYNLFAIIFVSPRMDDSWAIGLAAFSLAASAVFYWREK